jgi:hypothetical protein
MGLPRLGIEESLDAQAQITILAINISDKQVNELDHQVFAGQVLDSLDDAFSVFTEISDLQFRHFSDQQRFAFYSRWNCIYRVWMALDKGNDDFFGFCQDFLARVNKLFNNYLSDRKISAYDFFPSWNLDK